ncbi:MAG: GNAT family N-acetyltransferase [bacterium]|nr:GNAT family N-acetyltransferase [bacterium]
MTIRIANPETDFPQIAQILTRYSTEAVTVAELWDDEKRMMHGKIRRRWVSSDDQTGAINGYALVIKYPSEPIDLFHTEIVVMPNFHRQGIGRTLYTEALTFAREHGCGRLMTTVKDDDVPSLTFGKNRGFDVSHHVFDSTLDVVNFDETPFMGVIESLQAQGISFITLAETGMNEASVQALYTLNRNAVLEEPGSTGTFPTYENWRRIVLDSSWYRPESQFIAVDGDQYIGLAGVYNEPDNPQEMFNGYTGVDSRYRGRKIALSLKLLTIRYAREHGAKTISTDNDARNAPMLKINQKLGYVASAGHFVLVKELK